MRGDNQMPVEKKTNNYPFPDGEQPGNAPYDPIIGHPAMKGRRWQISWDKNGKSYPKILNKNVDMSGTRTLRAGAERVDELDVLSYKKLARGLMSC